MSPRVLPISDNAKKQAMAAVTSGATYAEAAELIGVSAGAVYLWCKSSGVANKQRASVALIDSAMLLVSEGMSPNEVADVLGVTPSTVRSWKKRCGVRAAGPKRSCHEKFRLSRLSVESLEVVASALAKRHGLTVTLSKTSEAAE